MMPKMSPGPVLSTSSPIRYGNSAVAEEESKPLSLSSCAVLLFKRMNEMITTREYLLVGLANQEGPARPKQKRKDISVSNAPLLSDDFLQPWCSQLYTISPLRAQSKLYHTQGDKGNVLDPVTS